MAATNDSGDDSIDLPTPIDVEQTINDHLERGEEEGSHTEWDPSVFHPSQVGYSKWLLMVKKLGLSDSSDLLGTFKMGDLVHEYVQEAVLSEPRNGVFDKQVEGEIDFEEDGLRFVGHYDMFDGRVVYDIKSRGSWYNFNPPVDRHIDQLHVYMRALNAQYGQVIYVSKKDMEVRTWPEGAPFTFDEDRWEQIKAKCADVRDTIIESGYPRSEDEIPFEKPDNYFANNTDLDFSGLPSDDQ